MLAFSKIVVILLIIGLVTGTSSGYLGAAYGVYQPQISKLQYDISSIQVDLSNLEANYDFLSSMYNQLNSRYNILSVKNDQLTTDLKQLNSSYLALQSDNQKLETDYASLTEKHDQLSDSYIQLDLKHNQLQSNYNTLIVEYAIVKDDYDNLNAEHNTLQTKYSNLQQYSQELTSYSQNLYDNYLSLQSLYSSLLQEQETLFEEALFPPYTIMSGREVTWAFKTSYGELRKWNMPIATYKSYITEPYPTESISLWTDAGETLQIRDYTRFVDDWSFSSSIPSLYYKVNDERQFVYEVWYIVSQLTVYSKEITDTPRWSLETLTEAGGDTQCMTTFKNFEMMLSRYFTKA